MSGPLATNRAIPYKIEWTDLVINGCSLATLKEQWAIAYHLPGATADFSPELTQQAQGAFERTKRTWAEHLKTVNETLAKPIEARRAEYLKLVPSYKSMAADGHRRVPGNFEEFEDSLMYLQYFYTEAMAIMVVEAPTRNSLSSCTVM